MIDVSGRSGSSGTERVRSSAGRAGGRRQHAGARPPRLPALPEPLVALAAAAAPIVLEKRFRPLMKSLARLRRSRRGRWGVGIGYGLVTVALGVLTVRHLHTTGWPLASGRPALLVAAGGLLVLAQALKALGWTRLFGPDERPSAFALAAGNGGAALIGVVLPGRFDDAMRVAVVRRYPGCPAGVGVLCLSLVMLGLIDSVALAPFALVAAVMPGVAWGVRAGLAVVAVAGAMAAVLIVALPRLGATKRFLRFRLGRWLGSRTTSRRLAAHAWALVSACWLVRAAATFLLLGGFGVGFSIPLALLFLCAGAAAAAVPIGPAGAATQIGAGAAALIASGIGASQALAAAVTVGALGVLSGSAVLLGAIVWRSGLMLAAARGRARGSPMRL